MRKALLFFVIIIVLFTSCGLFRRGSGCPTNGRNIGAERVLSGDRKAVAAAKKAGKYKTDKGLSNQ